MIDKETKFLILASLFITFLIAAVLLGSKIVIFLGLTFSAGILPVCLTYPMTDVICEIWGKSKAKKVVIVGLISWAILLILIYISVNLTPAPFWKFQEQYSKIFSVSARLILGGFLAYTIAQFHDIWAFLF